jgi:hypothetical protein
VRGLKDGRDYRIDMLPPIEARTFISSKDYLQYLIGWLDGEEERRKEIEKEREERERQEQIENEELQAEYDAFIKAGGTPLEWDEKKLKEIRQLAGLDTETMLRRFRIMVNRDPRLSIEEKDNLLKEAERIEARSKNP